MPRAPVVRTTSARSRQPAEGEAGGPLYCQGRGAFGTADGEATPIPPDPVDGERLYSAVTAGGDALVGFTCALDVEGRPFCFGGTNANGEICPPGDDEDCDGIPASRTTASKPPTRTRSTRTETASATPATRATGGIDQLDMDEDGIPDACDLCKDRDLGENNLECPAVGALPGDARGGGGDPAVGGAVPVRGQRAARRRDRRRHHDRDARGLQAGPRLRSGQDQRHCRCVRGSGDCHAGRRRQQLRPRRLRSPPTDDRLGSHRRRRELHRDQPRRPEPGLARSRHGRLQVPQRRVGPVRTRVRSCDSPTC